MGNSILAECRKGISETEQEKMLPTIQNPGNGYFKKNSEHIINSSSESFDKILQCLQRSAQIEQIYQKMKNQKPILYSIESKETLVFHNVKNIQQLFKKQTNSLKNFAINQLNQKKDTHFPFDLTPESSQTNEEEIQPKIQFKRIQLRPQNQGESSFSAELEKNFVRNRTSSGSFSEFNFKEPFDKEGDSDSIVQLDSFSIFGKSYIYAGFMNLSGQPHGSGQLYHIDETQNHSKGSIFIEGEFMNGSISTNDLIVIFKDASFYRGSFSQGTFHGKGHLKLNQRIELMGNFVYGFLEGKGKATYPDGGTYEGAFRTGIKEGKGKMVWKSQQNSINSIPLQICYEGFFNNDKMNGLGYLKTPNYEYWGPFRDSMKQGKGTIKFRNGNKFQGWFEKDETNGYGELHYANGEVEKGIFPIVRQQN